MSFIAEKVVVKNNNSKLINSITPPEDLLLNKKELEMLLNLIKNSQFDGKDLEKIFNLAWKLQEAYLSLDKDQS
ncbi:hypothetical protein OAE25_00355 [Verrucomicrobiales bacterium]|nr:hypothetical protein [Schleiferiaceae bacterium]MDB4617096.1 hypothetical protein [Verrucomicrobiales bacterium]|tara:strand:- start:753 stop:974 length:222 start_codon:yes stop_codon:yes gene_type:complete